MSTTTAATDTTTAEPKESLGISAALFLSLVGLTLLLVIAILIKREIRRGNVKSKRDGHFWSCKFFRKYTESKLPADGKLPKKSKPSWLLAGHHELPERFYTKDECPQYIARMFTVDLYTVLEHTCRDTFVDKDLDMSFESYLINHYPTLNDPLHTFLRLKIRAEIDLVPFTIDEMKYGIRLFNQLLQKISDFANNPCIRHRQVVTMSSSQNEDHQVKMSSKYIPLLPKDLCNIPLRPVDDDSLGNTNKRSRSKGRFPFHLPSFLNKRKFFSTKSSSSSAPSANTRYESPTNVENGATRNEHSVTSIEHVESRPPRSRFKRQTAIDAIPLVEFHDTLSQSATFNSDTDRPT